MLAKIVAAVKQAVRDHLRSRVIHDIVGHDWEPKYGGMFGTSGGVSDKRFICRLCGAEQVLFWIGSMNFETAISQCRTFYGSWEEANEARN